MIIFRPHRGGLAESMEEAAIFEDKELMFEHIVKLHSTTGGRSPFAVSDLSIDSKKTADNRIGWKDCRYVLVARYGEEEYETPQCIGYCATIFPKCE